MSTSTLTRKNQTVDHDVINNNTKVLLQSGVLTKEKLERLTTGMNQAETNIFCQKVLTHAPRPLLEETINYLSQISTNITVLTEILKTEKEITPQTVDIILSRYPTLVTELYGTSFSDRAEQKQKLVEHAYREGYIKPGDIPEMLRSFPGLDPKIVEDCINQGNMAWIFLILKTPNKMIKHLLPKLYTLCPIPELFLKNAHTPTEVVDKIFEDTIGQRTDGQIMLLLLKHENLSPKNWVSSFFEQGKPYGSRKWAQDRIFYEQSNPTSPLLIDTLRKYLNQYTTRDISEFSLDLLLGAKVNYEDNTVRFPNERNFSVPF